MLTNEEKLDALISLHKEAVSQLEEDLGNVKTDHGRTSIMSSLNEHLAELHQLEKIGVK